jgi:copper chaperone
MLKKTIYIPNISCEHCVHTVTSELTDLDSVREVDVSLEKKEATILYSSEENWDEIVALLREINYPPALKK